MFPACKFPSISLENQRCSGHCKVFLYQLDQTKDDPYPFNRHSMPCRRGKQRNKTHGLCPWKLYIIREMFQNHYNFLNDTRGLFEINILAFFVCFFFCCSRNLDFSLFYTYKHIKDNLKLSLLICFFSENKCSGWGKNAVGGAESLFAFPFGCAQHSPMEDRICSLCSYC